MLAGALVAGGVASAERGGGGSFAPAPQERDEEHVLAVLEDRSSRSGDFRLVETRSGSDERTSSGSGSFQINGGASGSGSGLNASDKIKGGPGCSIQCITSGVAYARGPNAELVVKTDTPARIWIHVEGPGGYKRVMNSGADEVMQFKAHFDDLQAGTTYTAWAEAKDTQGYKAERHGAFTTLVRNVNISFTQANLSSYVYNSKSSFQMQVWMDGKWQDQHAAYGLERIGYTLPLGIYGIQANDVEPELDFAIQLKEGSEHCNQFGIVSQPYHGPGSCSFLSFAELLDGENDLDARPAGATSWTQWTLERTLQRPPGLWPFYSDELLFTVPVKLHVTYTPLY